MKSQSTHPRSPAQTSKKRRGRMWLAILSFTTLGICLLLAMPFWLRLELGDSSDKSPVTSPHLRDTAWPPLTQPAPSQPQVSTSNPAEIYQQTLAVAYTQQALDAVRAATAVRQAALDATATAQNR
ncbi:MAG: hypothetical protein HY862_02780 [Chloroflexi bacterium]|nr:hypothetical protein [Chloroflexota bacterium]